MEKYFDHRDAINNLKASLFDIYEDQERIIGETNNENRENHLNNFINVKNLALKLVNEIEKLYNQDYQSIDLVKEETEISTDLEKNNNEEDNSNEIEDEESEIKEEITEDTFDTSDNNTENDNKYYLQCEEEDLPTAAAPLRILEKLKNYNSIDSEEEQEEIEFNQEEDLPSEEENLPSPDLNLDEEQEPEPIETEETLDNNILIKEDNIDDKPKGIIVRNDQYMKLALSKHRQEGVLKEAKNFRINEAKRKREELIRKEEDE